MNKEETRTPGWVHRYLIPLSLLTLCPPTIFVFWYTATSLDGSFINFWELIWESGAFKTVAEISLPYFFASKTAWTILGLFAIFQLILMKVIPGKPFVGPVTPKGNTPVYKANGVPCFFITLLSFMLASYKFNLFSPTILYDNLGPILGALNTFSLIFCLFLYFKGIYNPSSSDHGKTGSILFDYY